MTKFPNDEFDRVPEFTDRKGVHREDLGSAVAPRSGLGWILGAGILALLVGAFFFLVLPVISGNPVAGPASSPSVSTSPGAAGSASGSASGSAESPGTDDAEGSAKSSGTDDAEGSAKSSGTDDADASGSAGASESADPSESSDASESTDAGQVDHSVPLGVYNAATRPGLAGTGSAALRSAGFTSVTAGNWSKAAAVSVVYYKGDESLATAEEVAQQLGIATVYQTPNIPQEISVVLGSDFS